MNRRSTALTSFSRMNARISRGVMRPLRGGAGERELGMGYATAAPHGSRHGASRSGVDIRTTAAQSRFIACKQGDPPAMNVQRTCNERAKKVKRVPSPYSVGTKHKSDAQKSKPTGQGNVVTRHFRSCFPRTGPAVPNGRTLPDGHDLTVA